MNAAVQVGMDGAVATIDAAPKIFGNWGAEHAAALANIIRDLAKDSAKVYDGRKVASQRDELAYKIEARGEGAFEAVLVADVREGVLLPGGIEHQVFEAAPAEFLAIEEHFPQGLAQIWIGIL